MFGKNPILPLQKGDGNKLRVYKVFKTIQGEGPFSGHPAVFVRLSGCNLACEFCDTDFDSYQESKIADIVSQIKKLAKNKDNRVCNLVVITGGEPLRQKISNFCKELIAENFTVQIETNGTLYQELPKEVKIVCSPKNTGSSYRYIRSDLLSRIDAFKFLISDNNKDYKEVVEVGQSEFNIPVFIQPMDEYDEVKNIANQKLALKIAKDNDYIISLQTHKILGIE